MIQIQGVAKIEYSITGNHSLEVSYLKTVFVVADIDAISRTDYVGVALSSGDNFTFVQIWKFNNFVGHDNITLITRVYKISYDLYYAVESQDKVIKGLPFYVEFDASPLLSVFELVSTVALATKGISFIGIVKSLKALIIWGWKTLGETKVSPTEKLRAYYNGKSYSMVQAEISNLLFGYASSLWGKEKYP